MVIQNMRSTKKYSEIGSCPTLNSGSRPLLSRSLSGNSGDRKTIEEMVQTSKGQILVAREGDPKKPVILTYHDLALNYLSNFQTFFHAGESKSILDTFCIYHLTAPGQELNAQDLPDDYTYPNLDELSEQVEYVMHYYGIAHCVGFGCGLGANILVRFARRRPTMVDGLILINCNSQNAGWLEWVYHKVNIKSLKKHQHCSNIPDSVIEYLVWYYMGRSGRSLDATSLSSIYKQHFLAEVNPRNLWLLMQTYMQRKDLNLARELAPNGKTLFGSTRTLKCQVLNITGDFSPHVEATVAFNGRLQPNKCTWMKIQDASMVLEEAPSKVAEAVKLFLQGLGYSLRNKRSQSVCATPSNGTPIRKPDSKAEESLGDAIKQLVIDTEFKINLD
ncbi:protein NDRG3 isoform X3 [Lepeophtheirus salmonis]|uniref:protein NDRG3 isoform X3 n=1 Tax=Lepeophtheirus salmonis TaxID=72036 RepID=UPI003AF33564